MNTETLDEINETLAEFKKLTSTFTEEQLNKVPFEGSWTAGQLSQHMIMANGGLAQMLNGPTRETRREHDEMVGKIKSDFLNFNIKMQSPDFIRPELASYKKKDLLVSLEDIRTEIGEAVSTLDLTKSCTSFEFPVYGFLTRLEAVYFVIYHTQRHIHQMKNIRREVLGQ
jgi:hypothetical protein